MRRFRIREKFFDSNKSFICFDERIRVNFKSAFFQDFEIVPRPSGASDRKDQASQKADDQQSFDGVSLFFPE